MSSVAVVIPTYNMAWCIPRAVKSCQTQSLPVSEIIIVDDCSTDNTQAVIRELMISDHRIRYYRLQENQGHLAALRFGARSAVSEWVALLDADDEFTADSVAVRLVAANAYLEATGIKPQLVYGDHFSKTGGAAAQFTKLHGHAFSFLSRELCLCQTSTIMLGRECLPYFPVSDGWNTDDEIVLAIGKHFPILHSGASVAIYHVHDTPSRMSNHARNVFQGVRRLVMHHREDIVRNHGTRYVVLWRLRVLKAFIRYQITRADNHINRADSFGSKLSCGWRYQYLRAYRKCLWYAYSSVRKYLRRYFVLDYF
jgi:glycosyltransferase involved in cell wall biosynthesis